MTDYPTEIGSLAARFPAECQRLATVFDDTTLSYKYFWFLAALNRLPDDPSIPIFIPDLVHEMHVQAWHPVTLFRLSLGLGDKLQESLQLARTKSSLKAVESLDEVRRDPTILGAARKSGVSRYVLYRFLSPWFPEELKGIPDWKKNSAIREAAVHYAGTPNASPYFVRSRQDQGDQIHLDPAWHEFLACNRGILDGFARHHLAAYLQARNPGVPGIVDKIDPPLTRDLAPARRFWNATLGYLRVNGDDLRDPFSTLPLEPTFSVDHFLPWSFVAHDLGWNLCPVNVATNSSKSDAVPDLDRYLPRFADAHGKALAVTKGNERFLQDHCEAFRLDLETVRTLSLEGLVACFREVMSPQVQIARSMGFTTGWVYRPKEATP